MFYSPAVFVVDEKMSSRKKRSHLASPRAVIRFSVPNRMDGWVDGWMDGWIKMLRLFQ